MKFWENIQIGLKKKKNTSVTSKELTVRKYHHLIILKLQWVFIKKKEKEKEETMPRLMEWQSEELRGSFPY